MHPHPLSITFDLDGTLVDSGPVMEDAMKAVCHAFAQPLHPALATLREMQGRPVEAIFAAAGLPPEAVAVFRRRSLAATSRAVPFPAVIDLCRRLVLRDGVRLAILTGKDLRRTQAILRHHRIDDLFAPVIAADSGVRPKPDPAGLLKIAHEHGTSLARNLFVGDSAVDLETAEAAGVPFVLCQWATSPAASTSPMTAQAHRVVFTAAQLAAELDVREAA